MVIFNILCLLMCRSCIRVNYNITHVHTDVTCMIIHTQACAYARSILCEPKIVKLCIFHSSGTGRSEKITGYVFGSDTQNCTKLQSSSGPTTTATFTKTQSSLSMIIILFIFVYNM